MAIVLSEQPLDPWRAIGDHQAGMRDGEYGACTSFVGSMRDFNEGDGVSGMELEHYPSMTRDYLLKIEAEARDRWPLLESLIMHRFGALAPGDPIVVIAVWSAHRAAAFEASRYLIEELKHRAPFWKREQTADGSRWVEKNTEG